MSRAGALKVCVFTETFHPVIGGGETQALILGEGLSRQRMSVTVLTRRSDARLDRREIVGPVTVHRVGPVGRGRFKKWGLLLTAVPALLRLRRDYDVLFVSGFRIIGPAAVVVGKALGRKVVLKADSQGEMSGAFFNAGLRRFGFRTSTFLFRTFLALRNAILRRADAFCAITSDVAEEFTAAGIPPSSTHRIPNAVDTTRFRPATAQTRSDLRTRLGLPHDARIVTYTGRLVSYKGLPLLVRVWPQVLAQHPDAVLVLVGTGGLDTHACEDELRASVRAHGLDDSVVFTGGVNNVSDFLKASDVFAFPTENDAFPSSLVEAMAVGLPVVTTPVGAIGEVVVHGENGLLIEPGNAEALTTALNTLLADARMRERLGRAALITAGRYSAEYVVDAYAHLFRTLVPRNSNAH